MGRVCVAENLPGPVHWLHEMDSQNLPGPVHWLHEMDSHGKIQQRRPRVPMRVVLACKSVLEFICRVPCYLRPIAGFREGMSASAGPTKS